MRLQKLFQLRARLSGFVGGAKRARTMPALSIKNFVKFHFIRFPSNPPFCCLSQTFLLSFSNAAGKRSDNDLGNLALVSRSPARLAHGLCFYPLLKCLKRFIVLPISKL
jgi:hypothetical protein